MAKRVLVTGGAGFVGYHLCRRLLLEGHAVICLDNLQTGTRENVKLLQEFSAFDFVHADVTSEICISVDEIFNLACPASPPHYQRDPIKTLKTSILGAINVLELAAHSDCRVLQASTSEVYGDPHVHPQHERYHGNVNPVGVRACYDEGKRCAETLFADFRRARAVDARIARIFNTYGPRMARDDGRVVSNMIIQALRGDPITVYGDGSQTRSFCFVNDLVDGLLRLMAVSNPGTPINLGNPHECSVRDLARLILEMTASRSAIIHMPLPEDDPRVRRPDISLARSILGWQPAVPLEAGLEATIAYFETAVGDERSRVPALTA